MESMMASYRETDEDRFFDSWDEITCASDMGSNGSEFCSSSGCADLNYGYEFWTRKPAGVAERRTNFFKWMGLDFYSSQEEGDESADQIAEEFKIGLDRLRKKSDAVLANLDVDSNFLSARSFESNGGVEMVAEDAATEEAFPLTIRNLDNGTKFVVDELDKDGMPSLLREVGSDRLVSIEEFQRSVGSSPLVQRFLRRDSDMVDRKKKAKKGWLERLSILTHRADGSKTVNSKPREINSKITAGTQKVRMHSQKKNMKELSMLQAGQEFPAHDGSILTMKFSPDGQFLASAGEDGVVRVWKVTEDEYSDGLDIQYRDPSCVYFAIDQSSKLAPLSFDKEKIDQIKRLRKSSESACVILPPKVFRILEKPVHEFSGHKGEVLALSWSKNGYLLSSSVDKTARLWQVGCNECLGVYSHNNYVTCIEFNPVDDDFFISGSIDGKVRIWKVHDFRVIDWTDIREIVTAICYSPDGKGGIVGSIDGNCRFYDLVDNRLQLGSQICLTGKKKFAGKRITGFQFCPGDVSKVMVSSADSQIRILSGSNIISKFKGMRNPGSQASTSFTFDGNHVMSISEESNVYIWNYTHEDQRSTKTKHIESRESFFSRNASVAIPWGGLKTKTGAVNHESTRENRHFEKDLLPKMLSSFPDCVSFGRGFFLDSLYKGSATWPEEKLQRSSSPALSPSICKSEFKFLKSALQTALNSPNLWGLVIVTAGWDGCIKTFLNYGLPIRL